MTAGKWVNPEANGGNKIDDRQTGYLGTVVCEDSRLIYIDAASQWFESSSSKALSGQHNGQEEEG